MCTICAEEWLWRRLRQAQPQGLDSVAKLGSWLSSLQPFTVLNGSIVNVVLPVIGHELAVEPALLGWVVTAYSLVYAVAIPFFGRLADIFGARRFFVAGQAVFAVGSLLCVLAPGFPLLVVARAVQAAGGAAIPGLGTTLLARTFPPQQMGTGTIALVVRHRLVEYPFVPRALLASAGYRAVSTITICSATGSVGVMVGVPLLLARVNGLSAAEIGLLLVPNAVLSMSMGVVIGRLADRVGSRIPARLGLLLMLAALVGLSSSVGVDGWAIAGLLALLGLGSAFVNTPMPAAVSRLVAPAQLASGQSMTTMLFSFWAAASAQR